MSGRLFGVGVGPGDPELMTAKAQRVIAASPVVAHFAAKARPGNAWAVIAGMIRPDQTVVRLEYPVTTEAVAKDDYERRLGAFYDASAERLAVLLAAGSDVAVACEGDPFFYGSYMYLHQRLADRFPTEVVPGVTSFSAAAAAAGAPLVSMNETVTVLPGVLPATDLADALGAVDAAVVMKVGRHLDDVRLATEKAGLGDHAIYVERASCAEERVLPLAATDDVRAPYFSLVLIPGRGLAKRRPTP